MDQSDLTSVDFWSIIALVDSFPTNKVKSVMKFPIL